MDREIKKLDLAYSKDKREWVEVKVVLFNNELIIRFPDGNKSFKIRDLLLNNLTPWEEWGSTINCNTKDGSTFFLMGANERITSLFLNITNLRWRNNIL